jgi:hypothetical protein
MRYGGGCGNTMQDVHSILDGFLVLERVVGLGFRVLFFKLKNLWLWVQGIFSKIKLDAFDKVREKP